MSSVNQANLDQANLDGSSDGGEQHAIVGRSIKRLP